MQKTVSIIIPAYNESQYLIRCLENVFFAEIPGWKKQVIVVNDGSTDNTKSILKECIKKHPELNVIHCATNRGKGSAIRIGIQKTTGDVILIQDADLEYDPIDYGAILALYEDQRIQSVYGSRIRGARMYHNYNANFFFYVGGRALTFLVNHAFGTHLTDQPTGYKSWRATHNTAILARCTANDFTFEIELTHVFAAHGRIHEVPIHYYPRTSAHGKKITVWDFFASVVCILRLKYAPHSGDGVKTDR